MRVWINKRQNQVSILLAAIAILAVNNFILPAYESLSYYREKAAILEKQLQRLSRYSHHIYFHEQQSEVYQKQLTELEDQYSNLRDPSILQQLFGDIQRKLHLKVVSQEISKNRVSQELEKRIIQQTLNGKYSDHMQYLRMILQQENNMLLVRYDLENQMPFEQNPTLCAQLELTLFLPLK